MAKYEAKNSEKCLFCEIANGNIEPLGNGKFYENKKYLAWLSPFPNTEGFSVIIPKKHYESDVLQMPNKELKEFILEAKKVSKMLTEYYEYVGRVGLIMEGTGINHAHIKLFPMHGTEHMKKGEWKQYSSSNNTYFIKYEGYISSNDGPKTDLNKLKKTAKKIIQKTKKL